MTATKPAKITDFVPDSHNANKGTPRGMSVLESSVRDLGLGRSIVVDKNNRIIAGNKTQETAVDAGFEDALVVETDGSQLVVVKRTDLDLHETRGRRLAYADNRSGELNLQWDTEVLLADLQDSELGLDKLFSRDEIEDILRDLNRNPIEDNGGQMDRAQVLQEQWQVKRGDLWIIPSKSGHGVHRLLCGDSTIEADVLRVMGGEKADCIVTDPPYGVSYADKNKFLNTISRGNHIQTEIENDHLNIEDISKVWEKVFTNLYLVARDGCVLYSFAPQGGDQMMMMMMMQAHFPVRHELIWLKNNHVLGRVDYAYKHEPILYAWKNTGHKFYGDFQTSILEFPKPQKADLHPTMKPVDLVAKLIANSSTSDEIILDPFLGSGTTLVACEQTERQGRGIEISEKYCAVVLQRLTDLGLEPTRL